MRICPSCSERYDDAARFCPRDGEPLPVDEADARIGSHLLDQFELLEVCGKGAMGTVYRAWQTGMERQVAIKILRAELLRDPKTVARFDREARAVAKLQHPNIVTFFLVGHTGDGLPFLAMEYVEGHSLAQIADETPILPVPRALHIARQITSALTEAHAEGIVHRDLKPANILLTDRRRMPDFVKVLDFGIAKILGGEVNAKEDLESRLTRAGAVFGTPHYISPEQAQGGEVDHRADLYSLGVILYRLLTGRLPFDGTGINVLLAHIGQPVVPPSDLIHGFDRRLEMLILRALSKEPDRRFQSAEEMADALEAAGAIRTSGARSSEDALAQTAALEASHKPEPDPLDEAEQGPGVAAADNDGDDDDDDDGDDSGDDGDADVPIGVSAGSAVVASPPIAPPSLAYASAPPAGFSTPPVRPSRRGVLAASFLGLVLAAGSAAGAVWLMGRTDRVSAPPAPPPVVAEPAPSPVTPSPKPAEPPAEPPPPAPAADVRTITLGEEGYAVRVTVPRDPRIGVAYTLTFEVLDPSGGPLVASLLPVSVHDPEDHELQANAGPDGPGRFILTHTLELPGRHHVHVFPDGSTRKLHIWFDLMVKDADGHIPEPPKVAARPRPRPASPTPPPSPSPSPPPSEDKAETPVPPPPDPDVHEGAGASDPYHDGVIEDERLKELPPRSEKGPQQEDALDPGQPPKEKPRVRWRIPRPRKQQQPATPANPDGLE